MLYDIPLYKQQARENVEKQLHPYHAQTGTEESITKAIHHMHTMGAIEKLPPFRRYCIQAGLAKWLETNAGNDTIHAFYKRIKERGKNQNVLSKKTIYRILANAQEWETYTVAQQEEIIYGYVRYYVYKPNHKHASPAIQAFCERMYSFLHQHPHEYVQHNIQNQPILTQHSWLSVHPYLKDHMQEKPYAPFYGKTKTDALTECLHHLHHTVGNSAYTMLKRYIPESQIERFSEWQTNENTEIHNLRKRYSENEKKIKNNYTTSEKISLYIYAQYATKKTILYHHLYNKIDNIEQNEGILAWLEHENIQK